MPAWVDNRGLASIEALYDLRRAQYSRALVSWSTTEGIGGRAALRGSIRFGGAGDGYPDQVESRTYSTVRLDRAVLEPDRGLVLVRSLVNEPSRAADLPQVLGRFSKVQTNRPDGPKPPAPFPGRARFKWPAFEFYLTPDPNALVGDVPGPLVAPGLPPILNPKQMVDDWLETEWVPLGTQNYIEVVLPDLRARIRKLTLLEDAVRVDVARNGPLGSQLHFEAAAMIGGHNRQLEVTEVNGGFLASLSRPWTELACFIEDAAQLEIIDWAQLHASIVYDQEYVSWQVAEKQLDNLIAEWETQTVEFKENTGAADDVVESVVAFANSNDGSIIVGVSDSGTVVGVGNIAKEKERILNMVADWVEPVVNPTFYPLEYAGKNVLIVSVQKGHGGPYLSRYTGAVYLRRGSHDVPAKTRALIDGLYPPR